ncbi:hypothetical protein IZY60_08370 [Lutibacter sp. B2]|nr:hypothetical protein [Lutibacter sp. B2]
MGILEKLLSHFIEGFLMVGAGLGVIGIRLELRKMLLISSIYSSIVYGVRMLYILNNIPLGTHMIILIVCFIILCKIIGKQTSRDCIVASLISLLLLMWGDGITLIVVEKLCGINLATIYTKIGGYLLCGIISNTFLIITFFIAYIFKITIIDLSFFNKNKV